MAKVGSVCCVGFLLEGTGAFVLVDEAGSCVSSHKSASSGVCWGICHLSMILSSLSAKRLCCVPVLLVVWHRMSSMELAGL